MSSSGVAGRDSVSGVMGCIIGRSSSAGGEGYRLMGYMLARSRGEAADRGSGTSLGSTCIGDGEQCCGAMAGWGRAGTGCGWGG